MKTDNAIKKSRIELRLTQVDFAKALNISQGTVGHWEHDRAVPNSKNAIKLKKFFSDRGIDISLEDILSY